MPENPYFAAVEDVPHNADQHFHTLMRAVKEENPNIDYDSAAEKIVSNLLYVAGYYSRVKQVKVGRVYSRYSPYRI
jgi:hypothetical protein